jgi:hypothetical protein
MAEARKDVKPHSRKNPPVTTTRDKSDQEREFEFVIVAPQRPGQVVSAMAKRPIEKE